MKKITIPILILFVAIVSCSKKRNEGETAVNNEVLVIDKINTEYPNKDTTLIFDLDNISLEGTEAIAHYKSGTIDRLTLNIYGETGQARMHYLFYEDHILVSEKRYQYLKSLLHVKSDKDILPRDSATYTLNYQGKVIEGDTLDTSIGIFEEISKEIPFKINNRD